MISVSSSPFYGRKSTNLKAVVVFSIFHMLIVKSSEHMKCSASGLTVRQLMPNALQFLYCLTTLPSLNKLENCCCGRTSLLLTIYDGVYCRFVYSLISKSFISRSFVERRRTASYPCGCKKASELILSFTSNDLR